MRRGVEQVDGLAVQLGLGVAPTVPVACRPNASISPEPSTTVATPDPCTVTRSISPVYQAGRSMASARSDRLEDAFEPLVAHRRSAAGQPADQRQQGDADTVTGKSRLNVTRDAVPSATGSTSMTACGQIGPSMPRAAHRCGGLDSTTSG